MNFFGVLQLIFLVLKLVGVITWPWMTVLSPLWIYLLLIIVVILYSWFDYDDLF